MLGLLRAYHAENWVTPIFSRNTRGSRVTIGGGEIVLVRRCSITGDITPKSPREGKPDGVIGSIHGQKAEAKWYQDQEVQPWETAQICWHEEGVQDSDFEAEADEAVEESEDAEASDIRPERTTLEEQVALDRFEDEGGAQPHFGRCVGCHKWERLQMYAPALWFCYLCAYGGIPKQPQESSESAKAP